MAAPASGAKIIRLRRLFSFIANETVDCPESKVQDLYYADFDRIKREANELRTLDYMRLIGTFDSSYSFKMLASSTSSDSRLRKMAMMIPSPTAASAAATVITMKTKQLTRDVLKETRKRNERQVHGIQHQLDAHEHRDHVALDDHADVANREQDG